MSASFPSKSEREKCWASRDELWKCLDENQDKSETCVKFRKMYENSCPPQWVKHFDRKREYLKFKDQINSGRTSAQSHLSLDEEALAVLPTNVTDMEQHSSVSENPKGSGSTSPNTRVFRKFHPPTFT